MGLTFQRSHLRGASTPSNTWALGLLIGLLIWAPLPLASNRVWAGALLSIALAGLFLAVLVADFFRGYSHAAQLLRSATPLSLLLAFLLLLWVQSFNLGPGSISADAHATTFHALLTAGYFSAFALVVMLCHTRARLRLLAMALVASGVFQAILGVILYSAQSRYSLFFFDLNHANHVLGSFSYRNSMANYMILCLSIGLGLVVGDLFSKKPVKEFSWRGFATNALGFLFSPAMRLRIMLAVMVIALVLTRSRGGNIGFLLALLFVLLPFLLLKGRLRLKGLLLVASIVVIDLLIIGKYIGVERVMERLNETPIQSLVGDKGISQSGAVFSEQSLQDRASPAGNSLTAFSNRPLLGFGAGTFYTVFPAYAGPEHRGFYDHAHNDYVQLLLETGLVGTGLLAALVLVSALRAIRVAWRPRRSVYLGVSVGVLMAIAGGLLQAFGDFHFQIPANAMTFVVVLALLWSSKGYDSGKMRYDRSNYE
jgi:O-antigen ligase